jgi:hypothetical protein
LSKGEARKIKARPIKPVALLSGWRRTKLRKSNVGSGTNRAEKVK